MAARALPPIGTHFHCMLQVPQEALRGIHLACCALNTRSLRIEESASCHYVNMKVTAMQHWLRVWMAVE